MKKRLLTTMLVAAGVMGARAQQVPQVMNVMSRWSSESRVMPASTVPSRDVGRPKVSRQTVSLNYDCHVYVNGREAGHHVGGFTPFNFDVTDLLHEGRNFVIVKVDNKRSASSVPTQIFDWWNYGGITRDVLLVSVAPTYIESYSLQLDKTMKGKKRFLNFSLQLNHKEAGCEVTLNIPELKLKQKLVTDAGGKVSSRFMVQSSKLSLWSPENPKLYHVDLTLDGETLSDEIGFRTIETRGKQILLNGNPVFLKGICLHEEKPNGGGRANSTDDARTLLTWAKELGCNFVRLAHYPHNEYMVREAERMGIMVWSEIPCYWTIDWKNEATFQNPYDKPVIISEFGGGAKYGLHGAQNQRWTEEFQENLYRENLAMLDKTDGLAGTTPWILKDFRSPRRVLTGIQDYYNMKGLVSDKGERKKAWYVLHDWYKGKNIRKNGE